MIILALVFTRLTFLLAVVHLFVRSDPVRQSAGSSGATGGGLLLFVFLLLVRTPSVQRLRLGVGSLGGLLTSLLGVHLFWGFWATVLEFALMTGAGLAVLNGPTNAHRPTRHY